MSLSPSIAVPRPTFNRLPLLIALFCVLWSFAFVAGKIAVTYCPPLILLTARFSLAGILILGISALRRERWPLSLRDTLVFALIGVANNSLFLGLGYTGLQSVSAGLGGLIVSANPVFMIRRSIRWDPCGAPCRCGLCARPKKRWRDPRLRRLGIL